MHRRVSGSSWTERRKPRSSTSSDEASEEYERAPAARARREAAERERGVWGPTSIEGGSRGARRLNAQGSRLPAHGSRLTAHGSRLKAHGSRLKATKEPG